MKQLKTNVYNDITRHLDGNVDDVIEFLQIQKELILKLHPTAKNIKLYVDTYENICVEMHYELEETDKQYSDRLKKEQRIKDLNDIKDKETYERLKIKFSG